ncbi:MAG TPA: 2-C-methyl-D-erythritol 2,4-cyclodiphosphate synthase [Pseudomonadales bacterium]
MYRIGQGYDAHRFESGDGVTLGGVRIACDHGIVAHSDGDVLLHALCDALLGALALGDIGQHFPDTDERYRGADSRTLLLAVMDKVRASGYGIVNVDTTVLAQVPRLAPHITAMREAMAAVLGCMVGDVSVKATTTERMGFVGREEGIAAYATVLLMRHDR